MAGLLDNLNDPRVRGLLGLGTQMMAAGGPSRLPVSFGQAMGQGMAGGVQAMDQAQQAQMQRGLFEHQKAKAEQARLQAAARQRLLADVSIPATTRAYLAAGFPPPKPPKPPADFSLSPGQMRYDPKGKTIAHLPATPPVPSLSTVQKNAAAMGLEPGTEEYNAYVMKATTRPNVALNFPDPTNTKIANEAYGKADVQRGLLADTDMMLGLLDQGLDTDALKPIGTKIAAVLNAIGFEADESLPMAEAFRAMSNVAALRLRNPASGLGLTGNTSDRDVRFLKEATAGLGNTREANYIILIAQRAKARRQMDLAELKADHILENNSLKGFADIRRKYIEDTPIFTPEEQQRIRELGKAGTVNRGVQSPGDIYATPPPPASEADATFERWGKDGNPVYRRPDGSRFMVTP